MYFLTLSAVGSANCGASFPWSCEGRTTREKFRLAASEAPVAAGRGRPLPLPVALGSVNLVFSPHPVPQRRFLQQVRSVLGAIRNLLLSCGSFMSVCKLIVPSCAEYLKCIRWTKNCSFFYAKIAPPPLVSLSSHVNGSTFLTQMISSSLVQIYFLMTSSIQLKSCFEC